MASPRMKRKLRNEAPVTVTVVHGHVRHDGERHGPGSTLPMPTWQAEGLVKQGLIRFGATGSLSQEGDANPPTSELKKTVAKKAATKKAAPKRTRRKKAAPKKVTGKVGTSANGKVTG